jgi:hypothetical protein
LFPHTSWLSKEVWGTPFGSWGFSSTRFRRFDVLDNFVLIIMRSNIVTSQTLNFFPKNGWIVLLWGNLVDVKQLDVPYGLGFMMKSIAMHNNELFMETLCLANYDN